MTTLRVPKIMRRECVDHRGKIADGQDDGPGWVEGYVAAFGNVDRGGERIVKGAFAKTLMERVRSGKVPLMKRHMLYGGDSEDVIGVITDAREDEYGLWIHADFLPDDEAQKARSKIVKGAVWGLSVGLEIVRYGEVIENDKHIFEIYEAKLLEGTITVKPLNENAVITAAKSLRDGLVDSTGKAGRISQDRLDTLCQRIDTFLEVMTAKTEVDLERASQVTDISAELHHAKSRLAGLELCLMEFEMEID